MTTQTTHHSERVVEQRISLLLNRFWRSAALLWVSDGSRVYKIEHEGKPAVLKVFTPMDIGRGRYEPDEDTMARFDRELQVTRAFSASRNGLPVLEAGMRGRVPYMISPFVDGSSLEQELDAGRVNRGRGLQLMATLTAAVSDLHAMGYIHADLKPSNVLLRGDDLFLIDFGCAKRKGEGHHYGDPVYFSIGYTAPECLSEFEEETPGIDLFSLGMMAHEILAGGNPFQRWYDSNGDEDVEAYAQYVDFLGLGAIPALVETEELPFHLANLIDRACQIDVERRLQTATPLAAALYAAAYEVSDALRVAGGDAARRGAA